MLKKSLGVLGLMIIGLQGAQAQSNTAALCQVDRASYGEAPVKAHLLALRSSDSRNVYFNAAEVWNGLRIDIQLTVPKRNARNYSLISTMSLVDSNDVLRPNDNPRATTYGFLDEKNILRMNLANEKKQLVWVTCDLSKIIK